MKDDPIVEEVRRVREKIAAECNYEMEKIANLGRESRIGEKRRRTKPRKKEASRV